MQDFNYNDRLKILGLQRLEERRMRSDLIETFKIVNRKRASTSGTTKHRHAPHPVSTKRYLRNSSCLRLLRHVTYKDVNKTKWSDEGMIVKALCSDSFFC